MKGKGASPGVADSRALLGGPSTWNVDPLAAGQVSQSTVAGQIRKEVPRPPMDIMD